MPTQFAINLARVGGRPPQFSDARPGVAGVFVFLLFYVTLRG